MGIRDAEYCCSYFTDKKNEEVQAVLYSFVFLLLWGVYMQAEKKSCTCELAQITVSINLKYKDYKLCIYLDKHTIVNILTQNRCCLLTYPPKSYKICTKKVKYLCL